MKLLRILIKTMYENCALSLLSVIEYGILLATYRYSGHTNAW